MADLTQILLAAAGGDRAANARLFVMVYDDLRRLAAAGIRRESPGHTLQPTALVHEVYVKLLAADQPHWENRRHFYAAAGEAMRRILVDAAGRKRLKRGGQGRREPLNEDLPEIHQASAPADLLAMDEALEKLRRFDPRMCDIINLRVFVGMTIVQTAQALGVTARTINREWAVARAWLGHELEIEGGNAKSPDKVVAG